MEQGQSKTLTRSFPTQQLLGLATAFVVLSGFAADEEPAEETKAATGVMLAPRFMGYQVSREIEGAKSTVMVPAQLDQLVLETLTEARWKEEKLDWDSWMVETLKTADQLIEEIDVEWFKDDNEVFLYASIDSKSPLLSSVVFSEKFLPIFEERFGSAVLVVIPDRSSIFVFPKFASKLENYSITLAKRYRESLSKVSDEIFEIDAEGCRVVGSLKD
ncbi:MAG: hypothetical protein ACI8UO_006149 [Verrucomicrobiales bacterium]|jgi:hypothetical protein